MILPFEEFFFFFFFKEMKHDIRQDFSKRLEVVRRE